jgi:Ca-activated chloride channel family protein
MIRLANPFFLLIGIIFLPLFLKRKNVFLGYSHLPLLEAEGGLGFWIHLPGLLLAVTITLLILGFARPQWHTAIEHEKFLARDILLVVDLSHSMESKMESALSPGDGSRKIDVAKEAALYFVEKRTNDRLGLLVFGDETFGSWPLTRDLGLITKKVGRLGSTFYGGTNLEQPFLEAMDHFREMGQSTSRILVFLSDGEALITEKVKERIITELRKMDVHLYLLGINLKPENSDLLEIADQVSGRFIAVESARGLTAAFDEINSLEPSMVEIEVQGKRKELYPVFVVFALCLMFTVILLRNTLFIQLS